MLVIPKLPSAENSVNFKPVVVPSDSIVNKDLPLLSETFSFPEEIILSTKVDPDLGIPIIKIGFISEYFELDFFEYFISILSNFLGITFIQ